MSDHEILAEILPGGRHVERLTGWSADLPDGRRVLVSRGSVYGLSSSAMTPEAAAEVVRDTFDAWSEAVLGTQRDLARCLALLPPRVTLTTPDGKTWTRPEAP